LGKANLETTVMTLSDDINQFILNKSTQYPAIKSGDNNSFQDLMSLIRLQLYLTTNYPENKLIDEISHGSIMNIRSNQIELPLLFILSNIMIIILLIIIILGLRNKVTLSSRTIPSKVNIGVQHPDNMIRELPEIPVIEVGVMPESSMTDLDQKLNFGVEDEDFKESTHSGDNLDLSNYDDIAIRNNSIHIGLFPFDQMNQVNGSNSGSRKKYDRSLCISTGDLT
jgi:hypothetical protein